MSLFLQDLISRPAAVRPDHPAVVGTKEQLSYGELDALANAMAGALLEAGLQRGERVGLYARCSPRGVASLLGILRAGGVYVPIDPQSPTARAGLIVEDCGIRHLIVDPPLFERWMSSGSSAIEHFLLLGEARGAPAVDGFEVHPWAEVRRGSSRELAAVPTTASLDDLAYILYTSGSTGRPKGVMLSHRNALAFVEWAGDLVELGPADRVSNHAPFHFDLSVFDIYATLRAGATLHLFDEMLAAAPGPMLKKLREWEITVWYSVPSAWVLMLEQAELEELGAPSLRTVLFAGEVFPVPHLRRAMESVPQARWINFFGPTETNVCTWWEVPAPPAPEDTAIPIGTAASGCALSIRSDDGNEVDGVGEIGELFVEGPTVMLGYWRPAGPQRPESPYATGDRVAWREDGQLEYHGRRDHMVKVHGYRIELGEVEAALHRHPDIDQAVALVEDDRLVAVIEVGGGDPSVLEVKRHCAELLPRYMVPRDIRLLSELPRTSTGKTDRVAVAASVRGGRR